MRFWWWLLGFIPGLVVGFFGVIAFIYWLLEFRFHPMG